MAKRKNCVFAYLASSNRGIPAARCRGRNAAERDAKMGLERVAISKERAFSIEIDGEALMGSTACKPPHVTKLQLIVYS